MDYAFAYVRDKKLASGTDYPYTGRDGTCQSKNKSFKLSGFTDVNGCSDLASKISNHPISVAVDASNWSFYKSGVFNNCKTSLNHGVTLAGVDSQGNWKIRNSWGTGWGESGYIRLAAGNTCGVCNAASFPNF